VKPLSAKFKAAGRARLAETVYRLAARGCDARKFAAAIADAFPDITPAEVADAFDKAGQRLLNRPKTSPTDRVFAKAGAIFEDLKKRWVAEGCDPRRRPEFRWDPKQGANLKSTTGRWISVSISTARSVRQRVRQPRRQQRHARPTSAAGDRGADADPDPPPKQRTPAVSRAAGATSDGDDDDRRLTRPSGRVALVARAARHVQGGGVRVSP